MFDRKTARNYSASQKKTAGIRLIIIICAMLIVATAIFWCRNRISKELQIQVEENLHDVASQNALALETEIGNKQALLKGMAKEVQSQLDKNPREIVNSLSSFMKVYQFERISYTDGFGMTYTTDGYEKNLAFLDNYKRGMEGEGYISGAITDVMGKKERVNIMSMPVYKKDGETVAGVVSVTYPTEMFRDLISVKSFGGAAYSLVVEKDGTLVANSYETESQTISNNIFSEKSKNNLNYKFLDRLAKAMKNGETGNDSFIAEGKYYLYYMPVDICFDNHPSYIFTIVPEKVLTQRVSPVLRYLNILLTTILVVLVIAGTYYIYSYRQGKKQLLYLAYVDPITKGDNYASFEEKMEEMRGVFGYLISMEIVEYKIISHICGVEKSNETLQNIWMVLRRIMNPGELAAHVEAEHFILFLKGDKKELLIARLDQITKLLAELSGNLNIPKISPYFGIYPTSNEEILKISYSRANEAKRIGKEHSRVNYVFYDEMDFQRTMREKELEERFESALAQQEFEVWYQPKYSVDRPHIVGAEALTRWRDKDGTLIPPYQFIPLFEKNGMILMLDEYVFRKVCSQQKQWESEGRKLIPISVNISRASLYYSNIVEKYEMVLQEYHLPAEYAPLEITESATVDNVEIRGLLEEFHTVGFPLHLDDFGNGYSSLATLNIMHFDTLKLDKSLIDYIGDEKGEKLLYYIVRLAKSLGMKVTAEGVETKEQVDFLTELKCTDIQGYYFSKPLPLEDFKERMENITI